MRFFPRLFPFAALVSLLWMTGCRDYQGSDQSEQQHPTLKKAREMVKTQDREGAERLLREFLRDHPDFAHAHLQLGMIYQAEEKPVKAIYHFEEYLAQRPDTPKAEVLKPLVGDEKKRLALIYGKEVEESDPGSPAARIRGLEEQLERTQRDLARANLELEQARLHGGESSEPPPDWAREKLALLKEIDRLRSGGATETGDAGGEEDLQVEAPRTYTVKRGDMLGSIARKVYGRGSAWRRILEANRDQLRTEKDLRPGMVLIIPE